MMFDQKQSAFNASFMNPVEINQTYLHKPGKVTCAEQVGSSRDKKEEPHSILTALKC